MVNVSKVPACRLTSIILFSVIHFSGFGSAVSAQGDKVACDGMTNSTWCDGVGHCQYCGSNCGEGWVSKYLGFKETLAGRGVSFQSNLTQFYMGNTAGGNEREFRYGGHSDNLMNIDFGKLGVQEGLFLKVRAERRFGESLSGTTGALLPSNVAADLPVIDREDLYITNFLLTQALSESFVLFAGKLDSLDGDANAFAHGRGIRQFSNLAFVGTPLALRAVPYSTLGCGFAFLLDGQPLWSFTVLNATDTARTTGFDELFAEGAVLSSELRVPTYFLGKPGHQLIGGNWSSREVVSLGQDPRIILPDIPIARQSGSWSLYWNMDQYLVTDQQDPSRGWGFFARAGIADRDTNPLAYFLSAGLGGSSPFVNREHDTFGVGYYYSGTSSQIGPLLALALGSTIGDGQGVELFYNAAVNPFLTITPDLQVISPSPERIDTALVAGLRMNIMY